MSSIWECGYVFWTGDISSADLLLDIWLGHHHLLSHLLIEWRAFFGKRKSSSLHHPTVKSDITESWPLPVFLDDVFMKWNRGKNCRGGNEGKMLFQDGRSRFWDLSFSPLHLLIINIISFFPLVGSFLLFFSFSLLCGWHLSTSVIKKKTGMLREYS